MALAFERDEVGIKETGRAVTVPDDPRARIMYYLDCVFTLIGGDDLPSEIRRLANFRRYSSIGTLDCVALLALAKELSPDILVGQVMFQSDQMCGNSTNKFFELSLVSTQMVVASSIMIGGQRRRVRKIMTFKMAWLRRNYLEPILQLIDHIQRQQSLPSSGVGRGSMGYRSSYSERRPLLYSTPPPRPRSSSSDGCCCTIL